MTNAEFYLEDLKSIVDYIDKNGSMYCDNEEIEATKKLQEKSADEMFEELGYIEHFKSDYSETYRKDSTHQLGMSIVFRYLGKRVNVPATLEMQELKAINKKCKELGWIE